MRTEYFYESAGGGKIRVCRWTPEGEIRGIVQFVHGIAEHVERYDDFASFLNGCGILVVAQDHMGHGKSISEAAPQGYFSGGWFAAAEDTHRLAVDTMAEFPGVPYVIFGHSMGSFLTRTILAKYPDTGFAGAIICGSAWMPAAVVSAGKGMAAMIGKLRGERNPSPFLQKMMFGSYNNRIEHPRTGSDWLTRDSRIVDAYVADPLCGFIPTAGLVRDMMTGILYNQNTENLGRMNKNLPCFFIAGGDDPVGGYGAGVEQAAEAFRNCGMTRVDCKIYPLCCHEIHNEINRQEIYSDVILWIENVI